MYAAIGKILVFQDLTKADKFKKSLAVYDPQLPYHH